MISSQREITSGLMDQCSRHSGHDIPSAVRSPDHQQGHDLPLGLTQRPGKTECSPTGGYCHQAFTTTARHAPLGSAELGVSAGVQGSDAVRIRVLNEQLTGTGLTGQPRS
jgi:hypothetical protein